MWSLVFLLTITGCSAQIPLDRDDINSALAGPPAVEIAIPVLPVLPLPCTSFVNRSLDFSIPTICCQFSTIECHELGGMCRRHWDIKDCDYTVNRCYHHNMCTCCVSCENGDTNNQCTENKGNCRKECEEDEYVAWWHACTTQTCRCCKKCFPDQSCSTDGGFCVRKESECPSGHYLCEKSKCEGLGCMCCKPCKFDQECHSKKGFCEAKSNECPKHYTSDNCECPNEQCRCCRPSFQNGGGPILIEQHQDMRVEIPYQP